MSSESGTDAQPPGGSWDKRSQKFSKVLRMLFTKAWLIRFRTATTYLEEFIACALIGILAVLLRKGKMSYDAIPDPPANKTASPLEAAMLFKNYRGYLYDAVDATNSDSGKIREKITNFFKLPESEVNEILVNCSVGQNKHIYEAFNYFSNHEDMRKDLLSSDSYGVGFEWYNVEDKNWAQYPNYTLNEQSSIVSFSTPMIAMITFYRVTNFVQEITSLSVKEPMINNLTENCNAVGGKDCNAVKNILNTAFQTYLSNPLFGGNTTLAILYLLSKMQRRPDASPAVSVMEYPVPAFDAQLPVGIAVAFFAAMPVLIASMSSNAEFLEEKTFHTQTLMFLMGLSETGYWIVNFVDAFILSFIAYIVWLCCMCFSFAMVGTDFSMLLVLCIIFIIAELWFQNFLLTFMSSPGNGKILTTVLLVLSIFFGYVNEVYTLQDGVPEAVHHVFCLFPVSAFQMSVMSCYEEVRNKRAPLGWNDIIPSKSSDPSRHFRFPLWIGFMWCGIDAVLYFLLFCLFNAMNPKPFGAPLIGWKNIFNKKVWRRALGIKKNEENSRTDDDAPIISVKGLTKIYKGIGQHPKIGVDHVSFDIKTGEVIVIIGPNGAGKSSILNTLSGAIPSTEGTLSLKGGPEMVQFQDIQNQLGIVFQDNVLFPKLSIYEHLKIFGAFRGIADDVLEDAIKFFADTLQLEHVLKNRAGDLSGGQKRKLCIALSLLGNPPIVIMDEPTAGVDVQARQLIWKTISTLKNSTSIVTTHALEEAEAVSSRLFVVSKGTLPFMGTSTQFREEYKAGYVLKIISESEDISEVVKLAQKYDPHSSLMPGRNDVILVPVSKTIPDFLNELENSKESLGIDSYTFSVEQLEDVLLRVIENAS